MPHELTFALEWVVHAINIVTGYALGRELGEEPKEVPSG
jgi:hypothetical protein